MKAITFKTGISVTSKYGQAGQPCEVICPPGERLVFDEDRASSLMKQPESRGVILDHDDLRPRIDALRKPDHWRGARVAFFRNRGIGDQLILSALPRYFTEVLGAKTYVISSAHHAQLWEGNRYTFNSPIRIPCNLDRTLYSKNPFYQGFFCFESVCEWDNDPEQDNVYDRMFSMCGIDPWRVADKWKRPHYELRKGEADELQQYLATNISLDPVKFPEWPARDYFVCQALATNAPRCPPFHVIEKVLSAADEHAMKLGIPILCLHSEALPPELVKILGQFPSCVNLAGQVPSIRGYAAVLARARLIIGPDSSALHFAAAFQDPVPAIGLWGPFSPESRTKYYPNQLHLYHPDRCSNAPCFNWMPDLPVNKCPNGDKQQFCEPFDGIGTEEVYSAIKALLRL